MQISHEGRSVSVQIRFWLEIDGSIHLEVPAGSPPHVTINSDLSGQAVIPDCSDTERSICASLGVPAREESKSLASVALY
jgi:hypothetical protein